MEGKRLAAGLCLLLVARCALAGGSAAPLADAVEKANEVSVQSLLENHADVNAAQADGMTALHWAAYHDDLATAKLLIDEGANAKAENRYGVTPLSLACTNGNAVLIELLLDAGADPNTALRGNETALMTAARTGKLEAVQLLIDRGADVNANEHKGQTALMWAAAEGHAKVVEALIAAGADVRASLPSGYAAIFFAVREGRIEAARALLKAGADVNEGMKPVRKTTGKEAVAGTSPLVLAVENGHFELAVALLEAGADPNDQRSGYAVLHMLSWVRKPNRGDGDDGDPPPIGSGNLTSLEFVKQLVAHGADVNLKLKKGATGKGVLSRPGATPFLMAAETADAPLMRTLVELGADPLMTNAEHTTPLMAAAGVGVTAPQETAGTEPEVLEAVALALKLGGDVNAKDDNGETAMHGAAYRSFPKVVEFLAENGAKVESWNHRNKHGWTPMEIAQGHRFGAFRPSVETIAALEKIQAASGLQVEKPAADATPKGDY